MQAALENVLYDYEVDVMFTGHVHHYERDYPVYQGSSLHVIASLGRMLFKLVHKTRRTNSRCSKLLLQLSSLALLHIVFTHFRVLT
jgi:hypothetical protein